MLRPGDAAVITGLARSGRKTFGVLMTLDQSVSKSACDGVMGFAGSQVISSGGSFSGATASARLRSSELRENRPVPGQYKKIAEQHAEIDRT
jgi:hypothetical protein